MKSKNSRLSYQWVCRNPLVNHRSIAACLLIGLASARVGFAQGTVNFNNRVPGTIVSHVYGPPELNSKQSGNGSADTPAGTTNWSGFLGIGANGLSGQYGGSTTFAQLLAAPGANQPANLLVPAGSTTTFRTGAAAGGFISPITTALGNIPVDAPVATLQMVVWDNSSGLYSTWALASTQWGDGYIAGGKSIPFNVYNIGGGSNSAPNLTNLQSFNIYQAGFAIEPQFTVPPQSQTVTVGQDVALRVLVSGSDPVSLQWYLNNTNILNATNDVYEIPSATLEDAGSYTVTAITPWMITNGFGVITSHPGILTVQGMPAIQTNPKPLTVLVGQSANFTSTAIGTPTLLYQWQFNGTNLPGSTTTSLTLANVQLAQAGNYQLVVTNSYGSATSTPALLTVADAVSLSIYTAVELQFTTSTNTTYYIQASPDNTTWTNFDGPIVGNGQPWSKTYSTRTTGPLFYRVWWVL